MDIFLAILGGIALYGISRVAWKRYAASVAAQEAEALLVAQKAAESCAKLRRLVVAPRPQTKRRASKVETTVAAFSVYDIASPMSPDPSTYGYSPSDYSSSDDSGSSSSSSCDSSSSSDCSGSSD